MHNFQDRENAVLIFFIRYVIIKARWHIMKRLFILLIAAVLLCACGADTDNPSKDDITTTTTTTTTATHNPPELPAISIKLPENPTDWQSAFAEYFTEDFFQTGGMGDSFSEVGWWENAVHSIYIEDVNNDGIPEVFLYWWGGIYPQSVLTFTENGIVETRIDYVTSSLAACSFLSIPETGRLVSKSTGHTEGTKGLHYKIYDSTPDGFQLIFEIGSWVDSDIARINGEQVCISEFEAIADIYINPFELRDFSAYIFTGDHEERTEYLNEMLFY
jgi:hypothetical protein